jgi:hypothetical protein
MDDQWKWNNLWCSKCTNCSVISGNTCNSYTLTIRVTDANGCTNTCNQVVTVTDNTAPTITATGTATAWVAILLLPISLLLSVQLLLLTLAVLQPLTASNSAVSSSGCVRTQTRTIFGC